MEEHHSSLQVLTSPCHNRPEATSLIYQRVLAITKRTADLCGTRSQLYAARFELVTATNMTAALSVTKAISIRNVIVCLHSWTEQERESIVAELATKHPEIPVIVRCPGCRGHDEAAPRPGTLSDSQFLPKLISAIDHAALQPETTGSG
jgi:hypothetical protein